MLDINLKQLEVFVTTAEYGSFTRAADVLYLSQSTVSSHIRGLEETLGTPLFDRSARRKVVLTEEGKRIYPTVREIVDRCRRLQDALPETAGTILTVGASTVPAQFLVPRLLADFSRQRPDCQFLLRRGDSARVHALLQKGEIAVGFVGNRMDERNFRYVPLLEDRLVLAAENSPRFRDFPADAGLELLLREPVVARERDSGTWLETEKWLRSRGIAPERLHILARMENPDAIRRAVSQGMGVSVLSSLAVEEDAAAGRLRVFELGQGVWRQICMVVPKKASQTAVQAAVMDFVSQSTLPE